RQARATFAISSAAISAAAPATPRSSRRRWKLPPSFPQPPKRRQMLDLGSSFIASVARDPDVIALVDGELWLTYRQWYTKISSLVEAFDRIGLKAGDHIVTLLQNRWEAATLHWACQLAGLIITPINWRAKADELDFCIENAEARTVFYQDV